MNFAALIKSELRKLAYARSTWWLLAGATALASLSTVVAPLMIQQFSSPAEGGETYLMNQNAVDAIFGKASSGYLFAMIIGSMLLAGEFARGTAVTTFLAAPKRISVVMAKIVTAVLVGAGLQIVSASLATGAGLLTLSAFEHATPSASVFGDIALTALVSGVVLALIGLAVGALLRNQVAAIVGLLVWMLVIDTVLTGVSLATHGEWGKFLISPLVAAMMSLNLSGVKMPQTSLGSIQFLDPIAATATLLGYAAVLVCVAAVTSLRRDID